ncbi:carbohydrate hydrolase [Vulcanimicrobium alpinum]|uniref:Carbohydrate hydrolase n=1 Tax=Vulcanimicrobium alpinum TaxID=3016050 RepID=A0AAN2CAL6_UNVUL|nr:UxaA family hydrolase [Vulcanimicrobium alpinum]BDE06747.1 carbohydrate hydrolase [Vulcanimicrobium alpinum]
MTFMGYRRANGAIGVRNHVLVLPSVMCANHVVELIGRKVPDVVTVQHPTGCSQVGADFEQTKRTMAGFASNPNVGAVLVVGLGCETNESKALAAEIAARGQRVEVIGIQECGGTTATIARGVELARDLLRETAQHERTACPVSALIVGTECGGSDGFSGITANPALGYASDRVVAEGGTVILAEVPELVGAEHLLAERAAEPVAAKLYEMVERVEARARAMHVDMRYGNPTQGNIAGGLTTIEEKSLGAAYKGGSTALREVVEYAERPSERGLIVMDTPGQDIEQLTGMVAGGAQVVVFTTGRGTPTGSPIAPVIKVATNSSVFASMRENMDVNAGAIVEGTRTLEEVGDEIFGWIVDAANGREPAAEVLGFRDFAINRIGPSF